MNTLLLPTLVDISILKPLLSSAQSSSESQSSLCYFSLLLYLRRTSAGSLRNKSFRPRSSRKLGRKHNKEWGGEKGNACSEKCMKQFRKMYKQLLIGAVLVVLIKEWLIYQLNQVCFVHLCRRKKCLDCYLFEWFLCQNLTNLGWREASQASLLFHHKAYKPGGTLPKSDAILISVTRKSAYVIPIAPTSSRFSICDLRKQKDPGDEPQWLIGWWRGIGCECKETDMILCVYWGLRIHIISFT